jgi:hypothetical protein
VTTHAKPPALRAPAMIKDQGSRLTRTEARVDGIGSVQSQHTAQIAAANTAITANTTAITTNTTDIATGATDLTALETRLGGNSQESFLGGLTAAAAPGMQSHSGIGTISGTPTAAEYNATNSTLNDLVDGYNQLVGRLQAAGILV